MNILDSGSPDQLRERAMSSLDTAQACREVAARMIRAAERREIQAAPVGRTG